MAEDKRQAEEKKEGEQQAQPPAGGKSKFAVMGGIIAGILVVQIVAVVIIVGKLKPVDPEIIAEHAKKQQEEAEREKMTAMGAVMEKPIEVLVNLAGGDDRFLKASIVLEYQPKEGGGGGEKEKKSAGDPEIEKRMPKLKDICLDILGSKTFDEIKDRDGKRKVLTQLKNEMNKVFPEPETIKNVYFDSFVVQ